MMGERSRHLRALLEHRDRRSNVLINEHHENFFLVAKKNRAPAARCSEPANLYFDNGLTHTASLVLPFPRRSELLSMGGSNLCNPWVPPSLTKTMVSLGFCPSLSTSAFCNGR